MHPLLCIRDFYELGADLLHGTSVHSVFAVLERFHLSWAVTLPYSNNTGIAPGPFFVLMEIIECNNNKLPYFLDRFLNMLGAIHKYCS